MHKMHPTNAMHKEALDRQSVYNPEGGAWMCHMGSGKTRLHANGFSTQDPTFVIWAACYATNMGLRYVCRYEALL